MVNGAREIRFHSSISMAVKVYFGLKRERSREMLSGCWIAQIWSDFGNTVGCGLEVVKGLSPTLLR